MKYDIEVIIKMKWMYFLVQFFSAFFKYIALKLHWSTIWVGSMLVHTTHNDWKLQ